MNELLKSEFKYFVDHQTELVDKYNGRIVVIAGQAVVGDFDSELEALLFAQKKFKAGTFLVQKVEPGSAAYTQTFHSRAAFA